MKSHYAHGKFALLLFSLIVSTASLSLAQTTEFIFQAKLPNSITPATDIYEMEFRLFDSMSDGNQIGSTLIVSNVDVKNRGYAVKLDFGAAAFPGADRFLEVSVRLQSASGGPFTLISPREKILSVPYAIRALDATHLGGIDPSDFVLTDDPRLSDARSPLPGSGYYVQNTTTTQAASNFNISGNGTAGGTLSGSVVNAATQFNIGGNRVLAVAGDNTYVGVFAGAVNTGFFNSFFGRSAGRSNTTGFFNSFVGAGAGQNNTLGRDNAFFGSIAGTDNTIGVNNSFFGSRAGWHNTDGNSNSFFGTAAGAANTLGSNNSFFGFAAGGTTTGSFNSAFGYQAGPANGDGDRNSFFGYEAGRQNTTGSDNSSLGARAGYDITTGSFNTFVGANANPAAAIGSLQRATAIGADTKVFSGLATAIGANAIAAESYSTAIGAGSSVYSANTIALGRLGGTDKVLVYGLLQVETLGTAGAAALCRNGSSQIADCSSSLRYKSDVQPFLGGLEIVRRLRPISFNWKDGGVRDIGFAAEDVASVEPLLITRNASGQVEGVKYGQITTVLVNAFQEQQAQIEALRQQINTLKTLVCQSNPQSELCKE